VIFTPFHYDCKHANVAPSHSTDPVLSFVFNMHGTHKCLRTANLQKSFLYVNAQAAKMYYALGYCTRKK